MDNHTITPVIPTNNDGLIFSITIPVIVAGSVLFFILKIRRKQ